MAFGTPIKLQKLVSGSPQTIVVASDVIDAHKSRWNEIHLNSGGLLVRNAADDASRLSITNAGAISMGASGQDVTVAGNLIVAGTALVSGSRFEVNATTQLNSDNLIVVGSGPSGLMDGGLLVERYYTAWGTADVTGTAQSGAASTVTLAAGASAVDDAYNDYSVAITGGTGAGQQRYVSDYVGATKVATVDRAWATNPDNTSTYALHATADRFVGLVWDESIDKFILGRTHRDPGQSNVVFEDNMDLQLGALTVDDAAVLSSTLAVTGESQFGGGYGSTGVTISAAGVLQMNGALTVDGASTLTGDVAAAGALTVGGGYGSSGITLSTAGVIQANGALTVDGASTLTGDVAAAGALTVGGGYGATGVSISAAGVIQANGALTVDGASTLSGSVSIGGGYGSTGVTISDAGVIQANGALTVDGAATLSSTLAVTGNSTLASVDIGGGYGSTGVSISAAGVVQANGALTVDGASTLTGAVTMTAGFDSNAASTVSSLTVDGADNSRYVVLTSNTADPNVAVSLYVVGGELFFRETVSGGTNLVTQITDNGGLNTGEIDTGGITGTTSTTYTINNDASAASDQDPGLVFIGGDGVAAANDDLVKSTFIQDSPDEFMQFYMQRSRNGGAYAQVAPSFQLGLNAGVADLDPKLQFNAGTGAAARVGTIVMDGSAGDLVITSTTSISAVSNFDAEAGLDVTGGALTVGAGGSYSQTSGAFAYNAGTGAFSVDSLSLSLDAAGGASNVSNTAGNMTLSTITSGTLFVTAAALLDIDAAANIDIDVTGTFDVLSTGVFSIDGTGASNVSATSGNMTISTITSGTLILASAAAATFDAATSVTIGGTNATSLDLSKTGVMTTVKGTLNVDEAVTLDTTLAVTGQASFSDDVVVAKGKSMVTSGWTTTGVASGEVVYASDADTVLQADADDSSAAKIIGVLNDTGEVVHCGPCNFRLDASGCAAGDRLYASPTAGRVTATAPSTATQYVAPVGFALAVIAANGTGRGVFMREPAILLN